jgi:hypothetical protein
MVLIDSSDRALNCTRFLAVRSSAETPGQFEFRNYRAHTSVYGGLAILDALSLCPNPRIEPSLVQDFCKRFHLSDTASRELVSMLLEAKLLVDAQDPEEIFATQECAQWERFGWSEAFFLHCSTRDYPFLDYSTPNFRAPDFALMEEYRRSSEPPPRFKAYDSFPRIALEPPKELSGSCDLGLCLAGKSDKDLRPMTDSLLSTLLFEVFGCRGTFTWKGQGDFLLKSSPSGGARHPTECYLLLGEASALGPSVCHYSVKEHALRKLHAFPGMLEFEQTLRKCFWDYEDRITFMPHCVLILSSVVERAQWRYRDPRSHRAIIVDAGHLLGTCRAVLNKSDVNYFVTHGLREREIESLLAVAPEEEVLLQAVFIQ